MQNYSEAWDIEGLDPWVSRVLRHGYQIPFLCKPPLTATPVAFSTYQPQTPRFQALEEAIETMKTKQAIEPADGRRGFYSRMFVVPKATGGWRPIIDLSPLNKMVQLTKFRMETPQQVLAAVNQGDWMVSIDLKDAYFQVPIHPRSRPYLRFVWDQKDYQFKALCFGLCTAPQVFTRVMTSVATLCHKQGIRLHRYLDDWLIVAESRQEIESARDWTIQLAEHLGLLINWEKSDLIPTQKIVYLGIQIDTIQGRAFPSEPRVQKLIELILLFRESDSLPAWEWLRLLGHLVSLEKLVPWGRSHLRSIQYQLQTN